MKKIGQFEKEGFDNFYERKFELARLEKRSIATYIATKSSRCIEMCKVCDIVIMSFFGVSTNSANCCLLLEDNCKWEKEYNNYYYSYNNTNNLFLLLINSTEILQHLLLVRAWMEEFEKEYEGQFLICDLIWSYIFVDMPKCSDKNPIRNHLIDRLSLEIATTVARV